jgi:hypothetical protein
MKIFSIISLLALVSSGVARRGNRFGAFGDKDIVPEKSRVTAFVNTEDGLRVQCWEIGDLLPRNGDENARAVSLGGSFSVTLLTFLPSVSIIKPGGGGTGIDLSMRPNLFTVKGGIILVETEPGSGGDLSSTKDPRNEYVFADVNGDDWFYFEDQTEGNYDDHGQCMRSKNQDQLSMRTISGSDTTLINFGYERTPKHKVLHEGRCNFAGLQPLDPPGRKDPESFRFRSQDL